LLSFRLPDVAGILNVYIMLFSLIQIARCKQQASSSSQSIKRYFLRHCSYLFIDWLLLDALLLAACSLMRGLQWAVAVWMRL